MKTEIDTLVQNFATQLPNLEQAFQACFDVPMTKRPEWAKQQRAHIFRDGWFVNTPLGTLGLAESVQQHVQHLHGLIDEFLPDELKAKAHAYNECHDDQEVIAHAVIDGVRRDLNPLFNRLSYAITENDKDVIERLAFEAIYQGFPEQIELWAAYKDRVDDAAKAFAGLDKVSVMWRCVEHVKSGKFQPNDFKAYWDYWTLQRAEEKLPQVISDIYKTKLYPEIQGMKIS